MPILQVFAYPADDAIHRLGQMCAAVAHALELETADVVATRVSVEQTVIDGVDHPSWPVVVIHGASRPPAQMDAAIAAVTNLARAWGGHDNDGAWVTWLKAR
ncbi:hypothetical protein BH24ACT5_BH24ACT5_00990 [soil metagenome]